MTADGSAIYGTRGTGTAKEPVRWTAAEGVVSLAPVLASTLGTQAEGWKFQTVRAISADGSLLFGEGELRGSRISWVARMNGSLPAFAPFLRVDPPNGYSIEHVRTRRLTVITGAFNATRVTLRSGTFRRTHQPSTRTWSLRVPLRKGKNIIRITAEGPGGTATETLEVTPRLR